MAMLTPATVHALLDEHGLHPKRSLGQNFPGDPNTARRVAGLLGGASTWACVSNLPYNVAVPVVVRLLEEAPPVERILVMVQREVGERLAAGPGDPQYGAVSVKVAYFAEARVVGLVPPTVFVPRPKVDSALVRLR